MSYEIGEYYQTIKGPGLYKGVKYKVIGGLPSRLWHEFEFEDGTSICTCLEVFPKIPKSEPCPYTVGEWYDVLDGPAMFVGVFNGEDDTPAYRFEFQGGRQFLTGFRYCLKADDPTKPPTEEALRKYYKPHKWYQVCGEPLQFIGWMQTGEMLFNTPEGGWAILTTDEKHSECNDPSALKKPVVDWAAMPAWAVAVAMDQDGVWYCYTLGSPVLGQAYWHALRGGLALEIPPSHAPKFDGDWKDSLAVRPGVQSKK